MGGIVRAVSKAVTSVVKVADKVVTSVGKTIEAVAKNPLPVIETIALTAVGVPAPLASAMVTGMNGGSVKDMATAALASSVPVLGEKTATALNVPVAVGTAIASTGVQVALGVPLEKAIVNTAISAAAQSTAPAIKAEVSSVLKSTSLANMVTNMAIAAEVGILKGSSAEQIGQSMTMTAIYSAPAVLKEAYNNSGTGASNFGGTLNWDTPIQPDPSVSPDTSEYTQIPFSPIVGEPNPVSSGAIESSQLPPLEPPRIPDYLLSPAGFAGVIPNPTSAVDSSPLNQVAPPEPYTPPVIPDYVPADYSLSSGTTTNLGVNPATGDGLTVPSFPTSIPDSTTYPYDFAPDYGLYNPATDSNSGLGLQMPESPAIKSMGGGQGITTPYTQPDGTTGTMGALGFTPDNATVVLGDPKSFINDPGVTGQPIMASDPAYNDPSSWFKFSGSLNGMDLSTGDTGSYGSSSSKTGSSPLGDVMNAKVAQSYLRGIAPEATPLDLQMAQLQQLYPTITPDLSKMLIERGMLLTPQNPTVNFGANDNPAQNLNRTDANLLSAADLADFGQQFAKGGNVQLPKGHHPEFITGKTGHYAQGRGTGQSDDIPAVLYAGDYVMDADTVAALGDGSSKAGAGALEQFRQSIPVFNRSGGSQQIPAKIADSEFVLPSGFVTALGNGSNKQGSKMLDAMREQIRAHKRSAPETKIPPKAKSPLQYMREAMKG